MSIIYFCKRATNKIQRWRPFWQNVLAILHWFVHFDLVVWRDDTINIVQYNIVSTPISCWYELVIAILFLLLSLPLSVSSSIFALVFFVIK